MFSALPYEFLSGCLRQPTYTFSLYQKKTLPFFFFFSFPGGHSVVAQHGHHKSEASEAITKKSRPQSSHRLQRVLLSLFFLKDLLSYRGKVTLDELKKSLIKSTQGAQRLQRAYPESRLIDFMRLLDLQQDLNNKGVELTEFCSSQEAVRKRLKERALLHKKDDFFLFLSQSGACVLFYEANINRYYLLSFSRASTHPEITYYENRSEVVVKIFKALQQDDGWVKLKGIAFKRA